MKLNLAIKLNLSLLFIGLILLSPIILLIMDDGKSKTPFFSGSDDVIPYDVFTSFLIGFILVIIAVRNLIIYSK